MMYLKRGRKEIYVSPNDPYFNIHVVVYSIDNNVTTRWYPRGWGGFWPSQNLKILKWQALTKFQFGDGGGGVGAGDQIPE